MFERVSGIAYSTKSLENNPQYLYYTIYKEIVKGKVSLYSCIVWEADHTPKIREIKSVNKLKEHLKSEGFSKGFYWLGFKLIDEFDSIDDFITYLISDKEESLIRRISESFWAPVTDTFKLVEEANKEIIKAQPA